MTKRAMILLLTSVAMPAAAQEPVMLDAVVLEAESDDTLEQSGYVATEARQATKVDTPIAEIPQAVTVVTQDQIEDQRPRTLNETLTYSASANPNNYGYDSRFDAFTLRGFPAFYNGVFRDGVRQFNAPTALFKHEPYGLEGLAILKGPASSLYGVSGPGGVVNMVTKRPKGTPYREIEVTSGQGRRAQIAADFSGPLGNSGRLSYRLTGLKRSAETDLEGFRDDKTYLAPALKYDDGITSVTLLAEASTSLTGGTAGYYNPSYGEVSDLYSGDPRYNDFVQDQWRIGYEVSHRLTDSLTLRQNARISHVDIDLQYSGFYPNGGRLLRYWGHYLEDVDTASIDTSLAWEGTTGPVSHEIVAGVDLTFAEYEAFSALEYVSLSNIQSAEVPFSNGQDTTQRGIYLHDQMHFGAWNLFASARFDEVETTSIAADRSETKQSDSGRSGRLGLSYSFDNGVVAYGNLSTSFAPNIGVVYDDVTTEVTRPAKPTQATQREIGVKYAPTGTNLLFAAALYEIVQEDGVVLDSTTGRNKQRQLDMTARGLELEAQASWDNGFSTVASYTHQKIEIDAGAAGTVGKELSGTPTNQLSLWGHYKVQQGPLEGLGVGLGWRYVGESYGDDTNTLTNDARSFVDAAISYEVPGTSGVQAQLNLRNVLDDRDTLCTAGYCYRDEGRTWTASIRRRF